MSESISERATEDRRDDYRSPEPRMREIDVSDRLVRRSTRRTANAAEWLP